MTSNKKSRLENKKFRSASKLLCEGSADPSSDGNNIPQQRLFYTNKDMKNYPFIDTGASIPIVCLETHEY